MHVKNTQRMRRTGASFYCAALRGYIDMGRKDARPDITKEVLEEYINAGCSQNKISIILGVTQSTIFYKCKKYGLEPKTKPSKYDEDTMIRQLQSGWTTEQMAKYFEVSSGTITQWIRKYGLQKYRKEPPKSDTKQCRTCIYRTRNKEALDKCNYCFITGHSRNRGQPETVCSKYAKGGRVRRKKPGRKEG